MVSNNFMENQMGGWGVRGSSSFGTPGGMGGGGGQKNVPSIGGAGFFLE